MRTLILLLVSFTAYGQIFTATMGGELKGNAAPTDSPGQGTYSSAQTITLTDATADLIRYTVNGSTPSYTAGTLYTGTFSSGSSTITLKAIGCDFSGACGSVLTSVYTITTAVISFVGTPALSSSSSSTNTNSTTISSTVGGANHLLAVTLWGSQGSAFNPWTGCTDNKSGGSSTYTQAASQFHSNTPGAAIYYTPSVASGITRVTCTSTGNSYVGMSVWELQNIAQTSPQDGAGTGHDSTASPITCGSLVTSNANDIVISVLSSGTTLSYAGLTAGSGYTIPTSGGVQQDGVDYAVGGGMYQIVSSTSTYSPTWSAGDSTYYACATAAFKAAP